MNILFITAHPFLPQMKGGLQSSTHELAHHLARRGHKVSLLCALMGDGWLGLRGRVLMKALRWKAAPDTLLGYPVWRAWFPWQAVSFASRRVKPDIILVLARLPVRMALAAHSTGVPILMILQDVEFDDHGGSFAELGKIPCVANSEFTAGRYRAAFGVDPKVIAPLIRGTGYQTQTTRENITFINPHPKKGLDIALGIARACPDIPFSFVETWPLGKKARKALEKTLAGLPNVTLLRPVSDMREIYGKCRILLAPSRWEEAFGRVAVEAQFSGIPVIASNRGGLPEAVGEGGVLLDPDGPIESWIETTRRLWTDQSYYNALSKAATDHSLCPSFEWETQMMAWEQSLEDARAAFRAA